MSDTLVLIDAYAQIYRGYYAIRYLSNSKGEPTNAIFAIAKFLLKMHKEFPGERGAFVFDVGRPAFRMELAPDYKANRPPMPDDMRSQLPIIKQLIEAFGWPAISKEGYEADDLLAAIALDYGNQEVRIVSSDKDIHQVITENVKMLVPDRKSGFQLRGPAEVLEKFSVGADKIIDYLALIGDSSDNIPGVPGVGPKTAAKLINECDSIDNMLAQPELISNPKLREKIVAHDEIIRKNQKLVKLKTDVEDKPWADDTALSRREPDWSKLAEIARGLELKSILKEIEQLSDGKVTSAEPEKSAPAPEEQDKNAEQPDLFGDF